MGLGDKIKDAAEKAIGDAKEAFGKLTNNSKLEAEGKIEQGTADVKLAGEHVKDAVDEK
ncbi:MAG: CsbD family protein [Arthrobacter sp.]|nr:CsbD family protein [Arthrobacter sp.]